MMSEQTDIWGQRWIVKQRGWGVNDAHRYADIGTYVDAEFGRLWQRIATIGGPDDPDALGIAHLMAAAPELRHALRALLDFVQETYPDEVLDRDERYRGIQDISLAALGSAGSTGVKP